MSAEYLMKMEVLRHKRENLTARRQEIERRIALREATAAEYSAIALQSCKQKWKSLRASAIAGKKRNDEFVRELHETQRKIDEVYVRTTQKLWPSDNQLELEKARYLRKAEELYPAWQEKRQAVRIQTLRVLEEKKRAIEKRRYLAIKTFQTEQTLDDLIQQTSHEIGLAENLEKNEAFEREVLRSQSAIQATRLDESIREHAAGARMYMKQQAFEQLTKAQHVQSDVEDQIFETFSPRGAVKAMREANNSMSFVESGDNNAEDLHDRPQRSMSIAIPQQHLQAHAVEDPLPDPYVNTHLPPANDTAANARVWARSGLGSGSEKLSASSSKLPVTQIRVPHDACSTHDPTVIPDRSVSSKKVTAPQSRPELNESKNTHATSTTQRETANSAFTCAGDHPPELATAFQRLSANAVIHPTPQTMNGEDDTQDSPHKLPSPHILAKDDDYEKSALKAGFAVLMTTQKLTTKPESPGRLQQPLIRYEDTSKLSPLEPHPHAREVSSNKEFADSRPTMMPTAPVPTSTDEGISVPAAEEIPQLPIPLAFDTYRFVELTREESPPKVFEVEEKVSTITAQDIQKTSPLKAEDGARPADLSLNLIDSLESIQSSVMDFSVGKLLQTPMKVAFDRNDPVADRQSSPPTAHVLLSHTPEKDVVSSVPPSRTASIEKKPSTTSADVSSDQVDTRTSSFGARQITAQPATESRRNAESSLVFSSLDSTSEFGFSPATKLVDDTLIESVSDFGSPVLTKNEPLSPKHSSITIYPPQSPTDQEPPARLLPSLFATMSMPERLKALNALIARVEVGVNDGEQLGGATDSESPRDTKRDLLRMAASGRNAQINFFGSDVCFELVVDLARELGPVLFPTKAFEGILNDQKMKKVHQNGKEKEADMWKAFSTHIKQLHIANAMPVSPLVDLFATAFLSHDPTNQRSQRKLRELLLSVCGATESTPKKDTAFASPRQDVQFTESDQARGSTIRECETPSSPPMPSLLQTAFLQTASPPKAKTYGIATSSFKKRSSTDDVLKSMASSPTKLSQKLIRGGKMGDYSEFEEEDEVDLESLIGSNPSMASSVTTTRPGLIKRSGSQAGARLGGVREDKDDFDVDF